MKTIDIRILSAGILFLLVIASGMWLTRSGRPLNTAIFTVHKLIALACMILMIVIARILGKGAVLSLVIITALFFTFLFFIVMFATGAVLSFEKPAPGFVLLFHRLISVLTLVSSVITVWLLKGRAWF